MENVYFWNIYFELFHVYENVWLKSNNPKP